MPSPSGAWGLGLGGKLGYGNAETLGDQPGEPGKVAIELGGVVRQIGAGYKHSCALLADGTVRCWGGNLVGQLGYGHKDTIGDQPGRCRRRRSTWAARSNSWLWAMIIAVFCLDPATCAARAEV